GAAKGLTLMKLAKEKGISGFVFDVTDAYKDYWAKFFGNGFYAAFITPFSWQEKFDVVTSFFVMEHVIDPLYFLQEIHKLLKPCGTLYLQVPNFQKNILDLFVADHIHHYQ